MIGVSDQFKDYVRTSHQSRCKIEVIQDNRVVRTLNIHGGTVDCDRTAAQVRRFTADVADADGTLTPEGVRDILAPFGTLIKVYRGVVISTIETAEAIYDNEGAWNQGTFTDMVVVNGALQLG